MAFFKCRLNREKGLGFSLNLNIRNPIHDAGSTSELLPRLWLVKGLGFFLISEHDPADIPKT